MMERISQIKSNLGEWDKREKNLTTYRKLTQKSHEVIKDDALFNKFRQTLTFGVKSKSKKMASLNF